MRLTATMSPIENLAGLDNAVRLIAEGGYDCLDLTLTGMEKPDNAWMGPGMAEHVRELCAQYGICTGQTHAPFKFRWSDPGDYEKLCIPNIIRSIEIAGMLGARVIVVHPLHHLSYREYGRMEFDQSLDLYRTLLPYAHRWNVKIATENMYQFDEQGHTIPDMLADAYEAVRMIDTIADDFFTMCVDVGHAGLGRLYTAGQMIRILGHDRVGALHIHDNDNIWDSHHVPYQGVLDWDDICGVLREIRYEGDFCMEVLDKVYYRHYTDQAMLLKAIAFAADTGRHLISKIER